MATSVVTPVAGFDAVAPETVTRPADTSSAACSRDRASTRRTSSASKRSRRGGTTGAPGSGVAGVVVRLLRVAGIVERAAKLDLGALEDADVLLDRALLELLD